MAEQTPAAAMPAAAKTAPAPVVTPSGKPTQSFDVRMALAKNLGTPRGDEPPSPAATTTAGGNIDADPDAEDAAEDSAGGQPGDTPGEDSADDADPDGASTAEAATPEAQLEAVTKAFEAGDIEAMAKALEKPGVKVAGPVRRAFRAFQRRLMRADERDRKAADRDREFEASRSRAQQEIAEDSRRVANQERGLVQRYGWAHALQTAWENENMAEVAKALERGCKGATLATITQKLASGKTGKTPEEQALADAQRKLESDRQAEAEKTRRAEDTKQQAVKREAAVGRVGEALKSHPYLQTTNEAGEKVIDQEALAEVFDAYEASWNGEKFTKTARQCADALQEKLVARAKARGLAPAAPVAAAGKTGKTGKPPERRPATRGAVREPPRTPANVRGTREDLAATLPNRLAQARRLTEMQRRGVR